MTRQIRFLDRYGHQIESDLTLAHFAAEDFRVHKVQHNRQLLLTSAGLGLYRELDRAVAGLRPPQQIPVEEHLIADYSTLNAAIDTVYFSCLRAGWQDLVQALQPMEDISDPTCV